LGADLIWRRYAAALSFLCAWLTRVYSIALWYLSALHWRIPGNVAAAAAARIHDASDSIFTSSSHIRIHVISIGILLAAAAEAWAMMPWWLPAGTHCNASSPRWWAITITAALLLQLSEKHWPARACRPYTSQNWSSHVETPWRWHLSFRSEEHCEFKQLGASRLNCWPQFYLLLSIVPTDTDTMANWPQYWRTAWADYTLRWILFLQFTHSIYQVRQCRLDTITDTIRQRIMSNAKKLTAKKFVAWKSRAEDWGEDSQNDGVSASHNGQNWSWIMKWLWHEIA